MNNRQADLSIRAGVTLHLNPGEAAFLLSERLLHEDGKLSQKTIIMDALEEGRFTFEGECYIPVERIDAFNRKHGTDYDPEEGCVISLSATDFVPTEWKEVAGTILLVTYSDGRTKLMELAPGQSIQDMVRYLDGYEAGGRTGLFVQKVERIKSAAPVTSENVLENLYTKEGK